MVAYCAKYESRNVKANFPSVVAKVINLQVVITEKGTFIKSTFKAQKVI